MNEKPWYSDLVEGYAKRMAVYQEMLQENPLTFWLLWPIKGAVISQHFMARPTYYAQYGLPGHEGTDFAMSWISLKKTEGQPVLASAPGHVRVVDTVDNSNYGISIIIHHAQGFETTYAHLRDVIVQPDQAVQRGDVIGYAGNTGNSSGAHLHLNLKQKGNAAPGFKLDARGYGIVNPETFLRKEK
jgi:murein DD-endopeptidase MepM/ murein hydrolase activator NlpD